MAGVPVYMIAKLVVNDADDYQGYEKGFFTLFNKQRGRFIAVTTTTRPSKGSPHAQAAR